MKKLLLWIALLTLSALSCGVTASPEMTTSLADKRTDPAKPHAVQVTQIAAPEKRVVCNTVDGLNIRDGAGYDRDIIGTTYNGVTVILTGNTETPSVIAWYEITSPMAGWVSGKYLCNE